MIKKTIIKRPPNEQRRDPLKSKAEGDYNKKATDEILMSEKSFAEFLDLSVYNLRKIKLEAAAAKIDFMKSQRLVNFLPAMKFVLAKIREENQHKNYLTRAEISKLLGYHENYISELENRYDLPKLDANKYDLRTVIKWYIQHIKNISISGELEKETIRLKRAQAEKFELENAKEREILISKEDMIQVMEITFSNIRNKLLSLPNKLAHLVFGARTMIDAKMKIKKAVHESLIELADPDVLFKNRERKSK